MDLGKHLKPKHVLEVGLNMNKMVKKAQELSMIDGFIDQRLVFLTNSGNEPPTQLLLFQTTIHTLGLFEAPLSGREFS